MVEWLDDVRLNGLWAVCVDLLTLTIQLLNSTCRMSYAPISHSSMRKFVISESTPSRSPHGNEVDVTPSVSKHG